MQEGDTLIVTSLSSIARNTKHLLETVRSLSASGVLFKVLESGIDTSISQGEAIDLLLGAIVDFEQHIARGRRAEGIARAKKVGRYKGRKPTARAKAVEVMTLNEKGLTRQKIADELGIGVSSVYRILKTSTEPKKPKRRVVKKPIESVDKPKQVEPKKPNEDTNEQLRDLSFQIRGHLILSGPFECPGKPLLRSLTKDPLYPLPGFKKPCSNPQFLLAGNHQNTFRT